MHAAVKGNAKRVAVDAHRTAAVTGHAVEPVTLQLLPKRGNILCRSCCLCGVSAKRGGILHRFGAFLVQSAEHRTQLCLRMIDKRAQ